MDRQPLPPGRRRGSRRRGLTARARRRRRRAGRPGRTPGGSSRRSVPSPARRVVLEPTSGRGRVGDGRPAPPRRGQRHRGDRRARGPPAARGACQAGRATSSPSVSAASTTTTSTPEGRPAGGLPAQIELALGTTSPSSSTPARHGTTPSPILAEAGHPGAHRHPLLHRWPRRGPPLPRARCVPLLQRHRHLQGCRRRSARPPRLCPVDRLLVETDAPYLAPVPHRGRPNEPAYVTLVGDDPREHFAGGAGRGGSPATSANATRGLPARGRGRAHRAGRPSCAALLDEHGHRPLAGARAELRRRPEHHRTHRPPGRRRPGETGARDRRGSRLADRRARREPARGSPRSRSTAVSSPS